jgi:hypothetical protein
MLLIINTGKLFNILIFRVIISAIQFITVFNDLMKNKICYLG